MTYLIGVDEAGYGPNLGPLVISATLWRVPGDSQTIDLYELLGDTVAADRSAEDHRVAIADSKQLYQPKRGLRFLERGLLAALATIDRRPVSWQLLWGALGSDLGQTRQTLAWYAHYNESLPVDARAEELDELSASLSEGLDRANVRLIAIRSEAVFAERFNSLVEQHGTKGAALSKLTLQLVSDVIDLIGGLPEERPGSPDRSALEEEPIFVVCDKHGGRNRYGRFLQEQFPETLVEVRSESRAESVYGWDSPRGRVEIRFRTRAESFLPTALASMASKYLRELAMRAFNDFWCSRVENLRPTAGYPLDAKRFKAEISAMQNELGVEDQILWRSR